MVLTPRKAQDQYMPALTAVAKSLKTYGHEPVAAVMTDKPQQDKTELERVLSSLQRDVVPVPDPKSQPTITFPPQKNVLILSTPYQVNTRLEVILKTASSTKEDFHAAVDMEWAVNIATEIQGHVAVISIIFGEVIFLIPVEA
jgi:hypothetical protein